MVNKEHKVETPIVVRTIILKNIRDLYFVSNFICKLKIDDIVTYYTYSDHRNYVTCWVVFSKDDVNGYIRVNKKGKVEITKDPVVGCKAILNIVHDTLLYYLFKRLCKELKFKQVVKIAG